MLIADFHIERFVDSQHKRRQFAKALVVLLETNVFDSRVVQFHRDSAVGIYR